MEIHERHIERVAQALCLGASLSDVRDMLKDEGMSDYDVFLCYQAARLLRPETPDPGFDPIPKEE